MRQRYRPPFPFDQKFLPELKVHFWNDGQGWWLYRTRCTPGWQEGGVIVGRFTTFETAVEDVVKRYADDSG